MSFSDKLKKKLRPLYRGEQTSLLNLLLLRLLTEGNCMAYQLKYSGLKSTTRNMLSELRAGKNKNVFVFANGPSLKSLDFEKVKKHTGKGGYDLITVNSFASKGLREYGLKPTVGVFSDPMHYRDMDDPKFLDQFKDDVDAMNEYGIPALVPYRFYNRSRFSKSIPYSGVRNVFRKNVTDMTKPLGFYYLTSLHALALALHLGYENIYICGYDNSYFKSFEVGLDNGKYFEDKHFYDASKPTKRSLPSDSYGPTSHVFYDTYRHFKYLEKISQHGKKNIQIYNIAKETYTDAFPRNFDLDVYV